MSNTVERTAENYHNALNEAEAEVGPSSSGWDERLLQSLDKHGLQLIASDKPPSGPYPWGLAYIAFPPFERKTWFDGIPNNHTYVVWKEE